MGMLLGSRSRHNEELGALLTGFAKLVFKPTRRHPELGSTVVRDKF
jgi:hypothetical protein